VRFLCEFYPTVLALIIFHIYRALANPGNEDSMRVHLVGMLRFLMVPTFTTGPVMKMSECEVISIFPKLEAFGISSATTFCCFTKFSPRD